MALIARREAVGLLLRILESKKARISGAIMHASFVEAARVLLGSNLLAKVGQTNTAPAMDDYDDEPTRVEWSPERGSYGFHGSNGKWMSVPSEDLNIYGVIMPAFLAQLMVRCERVSPPAKDPIVPDVIWDIGTVKFGARGKPVSVWFVRRLFDDHHRGQLEAVAAKRPPADMRVVITSTADCPDLVAFGHVIVSMGDVLEAPDGIVINPATLAKRLQMVSTSVIKPLRHSANYGLIYVTEKPFEFSGDLHRRILKILVDAYNHGDPVCRTAVVLEEAGAKGENKYLYRVFNKNEDWRKFIKEKKGNCWIEF